jgi:energy-coupling factor transporter transmembrane protein EcfT
VLACLILLVAVATVPLGQTALYACLSVAFLVILATRPVPRTFVIRALGALFLTCAFVAPIALGEHPRQALLVGARAGSAIVIALCFAAELRATEVASALYALRLPALLVMVVETMLRQLGSIKHIAERVVLARRLRGARGSAFSGEVLSALFILSADRAERVALGMRLRGYGPDTARRIGKLGASDIALIVVAGATAIVLHTAARVTVAFGNG